MFSAVMLHCGIFLAVGGFSFFGGNDFGGSGKTRIWRYFSGGNAIRRRFCGGKRLLVFRLYRERKFKILRYSRCLASYMHTCLAPERTAKLFPTVSLVHTLRTVGLYCDLKREIEAKPTGKAAVTYLIMNGLEQPHAKRTNKNGKYHNNNRMP